MATADLIQELNDDLNSAYAAVAEKGGTVPEEKNSNNLASAIESITGGGGRPPLPEYPYSVEEFDGGEYGAVAYLRDDKVHYYTATSESDINIATGSSSTTKYLLKTLDDGFEITNSNVLGYAVGSTRTIFPQYTLSACLLLQNFYWAKENKITAIPNYFLYNNANFLQPMDVPEGVQTIGDYFMQNCTGFNQPVTLPESLTSLGRSFLANCTIFNQPLRIPSKITAIPDNFLYKCNSFDSALTLPDGLTQIGHTFMGECAVFNQPLVLPDSLRTISSSSTGSQAFMYRCYAFNQPLALSASLSSTPQYFLAQCTSFNSPITFRGNAISIGNHFLDNCSSFNQPIDSSKITSIGEYFLAYCKAFNQSVTLPNGATSTPVYFLFGCSSFNQELDLSLVKTVGMDFLANCISFNQKISLPSATNIGSSFLLGCTSFAQPLAIPDTVTSVGDYFMKNCDNFTGPLNVGKSSGIYSGNNSLSTETATAPMYVEGIILTGEYAEYWKMGLPDRTSSPYRKLIIGEEPTLIGLKTAMQNGGAKRKYPEGTEIPDKYDGQDNPLIVAQYLDSTNNSLYGGAEGVICIRKWAIGQRSFDTTGSVDYRTSSIKTFLDTECLEKCSADATQVISNINIPYDATGTITSPGSIVYVSSKWFLMSETELYGAYNKGEGIAWDYWKQKTGLSSPSNEANSGRAILDDGGLAISCWQRTRRDSSVVLKISTSGDLGSSGTPGTNGYVLPACFISKN